MKMANVLEPSITESGRAAEAFMKICPPVDRDNLDEDWLEMCGFFVKGWLAKAAEHRASDNSVIRENRTTEIKGWLT